VASIALLFLGGRGRLRLEFSFGFIGVPDRGIGLMNVGGWERRGAGCQGRHSQKAASASIDRHSLRLPTISELRLHSRRGKIQAGGFCRPARSQRHAPHRAVRRDLARAHALAECATGSSAADHRSARRRHRLVRDRPGLRQERRTLNAIDNVCGPRSRNTATMGAMRSTAMRRLQSTCP